jgi:hypothetical protein
LDDRGDVGVCVCAEFILRSFGKTRFFRTSLDSLLTFSSSNGTPNKITLFNPFSTSGLKNPSNLLIPHLFCPGKVEISNSASGSSVMKIGYMSMSLFSVRPRAW